MENKVVEKPETFEGVPLHMVDYGYAFSNPIQVTRVVKPLYKVHNNTYLGVYEGLSPGDILQIGTCRTLYRVLKHSTEMLPTGGCIYRVRKVDGSSTTYFDMQQIKLGDKVRIKNRRTLHQNLFNK